MPTFNGSMSAAVALMYRSDDGTPIKVTFTPRSIGLIHSGGYIVKEVFESSNMGSVLPDTEIEVKVNPSGMICLEILLYLLCLEICFELLCAPNVYIQYISYFQVVFSY